MRLRRFGFLLTIIILASAGAMRPESTRSAGKVLDPLVSGPYPVGVTTTVFVDAARTDAFTKESRTLVTEIWYPAVDETSGLPKNKFSDFIPGGITPQFEALAKIGYRKPISEVERAFWNNSVRDARVRSGKFPVIFFSHGNGGTRTQNTFWCDYLASHGYIVVSPDHTGNAMMTIIKGKPVMYQPKERDNAAQDRPKDIIFLLDQMTLWNGGADSRFAGRLDLSKPVAAGMSFGSFTAIRVADLDARFKAVIAMAAAPETHTNLQVPSLYMLGDEDKTIGVNGNVRIKTNFEQHSGPIYLFEMKNGGHYSFTDMFKINNEFGDGIGKGKRHESGEIFDHTPMDKTYLMINSYSIAFLGAFIRDEKEYLPFLSKNHWPDDLIWKSKNGQ